LIRNSDASKDIEKPLKKNLRAHLKRDLSETSLSFAWQPHSWKETAHRSWASLVRVGEPVSYDTPSHRVAPQLEADRRYTLSSCLCEHIFTVSSFFDTSLHQLDDDCYDDYPS
jgi:hypothetical protein